MKKDDNTSMNLFEKEHEECVNARNSHYNDENYKLSLNEDAIRDAEEHLKSTNGKMDFLDFSYFLVSGISFGSWKVMKATMKYIAWRFLFLFTFIGVWKAMNLIVDSL